MPAIYTLFQRVVRGKGEFVYASKHIRAREGHRILDIGCGTGDILRYLPPVEYLGFDMDERLIHAARKNYGHRGKFYCRNITEADLEDFSAFDIVSATGVLHHLPDEEAGQLFRLAKRALKTGGRLVTLDGCYTEEQSRLSRLVLSKDRGRYVRNQAAYVGLARTVFREVKPTLYHKLVRIPSTVLIMECTA